MKPIIGISMAVGVNPTTGEEAERLYLSRKYVNCITQAGGLAILIPVGSDTSQLAQLLDGWVIPGGDDIDPSHYGEPIHAKSRLEPNDRFVFEQGLLKKVDPKMPILGICYGCQFLNVTRSGKLNQHIPEEIGHERHSSMEVEVLDVVADSKIGKITGESKVRGHSSHHQAISKVGSGFTVSAHAADGTIEAIEDSTGKWVIGVQWHPERTPDDPETQALFRDFVKAAMTYREEKEACGTW